jgi:hypothetical protein
VALVGLLMTRLMGYKDFVFHEEMRPEGSAGVAHLLLRFALILFIPNRWAMRWAKVLGLALVIAPVNSPFRCAPRAAPLSPAMSRTRASLAHCTRFTPSRHGHWVRTAATRNRHMEIPK